MWQAGRLVTKAKYNPELLNPSPVLYLPPPAPAFGSCQPSLTTEASPRGRSRAQGARDFWFYPLLQSALMMRKERQLLALGWARGSKGCLPSTGCHPASAPGRSGDGSCSPLGGSVACESILAKPDGSHSFT